MASRSGPRLTRRKFAGICIGAAAGARALEPGSQVDAAQSISSSTRSIAIDQNAIRRRGTGLRVLDATRASPGLTLFSPLGGDGSVFLIDLSGKVVHTWKMPYRPGLGLSD